MRSSIRSVLFLLFVLLAFQRAHATHVRAGEITAKRISTTSLTYEITFTGYFDVEGGKPAADSQDDVKFFVNNDGPISVPRDKSKLRNIGNNTTINVYTFVYTFPAPGRFQI